MSQSRPGAGHELERLVRAVERAPALDQIAELGQRLISKLPGGRVTNVLSGTQLGHPLHPVLIHLPIGATLGAEVLDLTGGNRRAARRLVGFAVLSSLPAALSGASDWRYTQRAERRVGVVHAFANGAGVVLLAGSWLARHGDRSERLGMNGFGGRGRSRRAGRAGRWSGLGALTALSVGGWLGAHLAYAQGIGVDTTAFLAAVDEWTDACAESELAEGKPYPVRVAGTPVVLVRRDGRILALVDRCSHRGGPLHQGTVLDDCIECPWHGSRFRLDDGEVVGGPASRPQPALATRVRDGRVQVRQDEERAMRLNPVS